MTKILELENVYLELPDDYELKEEPDRDFEEITTRLSLEELQEKLEETQSLHL